MKAIIYLDDKPFSGRDTINRWTETDRTQRYGGGSWYKSNGGISRRRLLFGGDVYPCESAVNIIGTVKEIVEAIQDGFLPSGTIKIEVA